MTTCNWGSALVLAVLTLTSCSGPSTTETAKSEPEKTAPAAPAVPVTGKTAFYEMYKSAHAWAPDMLPLTLEAKQLTGFKNEEGKAAMWEATFGSPGKRQYCKFTYAIAAQPPDIRKGVTAAEALPWAGETRDARSFQSSELAIDSDEAYKTALEKAGAFLKQHPDMPFTTLSLGAASQFPGPVWFLQWGDKKFGFFQLVSASTGKALK